MTQTSVRESPAGYRFLGRIGIATYESRVRLSAKNSSNAPRIGPAFESRGSSRIEYLGEPVEPPLKICFGSAMNDAVETMGPNLVDVSSEVVEVPVPEIRD